MANYGSNIFLQQTKAGIPMPTPAISRLGYSPAIRRMASDYAQGSMNKVSAYMGQKGMLNSSFYPQMLEKAYRGGFDRAMGDYTGQQQIYNQYAQQLMAMKMQETAGQDDTPWWQKALGGAATGALGGMMVGGLPGMAIGAGIGALAGLLQ